MTRRILVDINVLLDVLANREPFVTSAVTVWSASESGQVQGMVAADSFTTLYYLLRRASDHRQAMRGIRLVGSAFEIVPLSERLIHQAIDSPFDDFEDAIQHLSAVHGQADAIVTRDLKHYRKAELPVISPDAFQGWLAMK